MEMKRSNIGIDKSIRTTRCNRAGAGAGVSQSAFIVDDRPNASANNNACLDLNKTDSELLLVFDRANAFLYPNPTTNYFLIDSQIDLFEIVEIFSIEGKILKRIENVSTHSEIPIELPKGMYLVHIQIEKLRFVQKLIVQ